MSSKFIGYFKFNDSQLGVFYLEEDSNNFKILPLTEKTFVIDEELEAKQLNHFGPDIKFLPQLIIDYTYICISKTVPIKPIYLCHLKYFIDKSIIYRKGMAGIFGIQWSYKEGYDSPVLLSEDKVLLNLNF